MKRLSRAAIALTYLLLSHTLLAQTYVGVGIRIGRDSIPTGWWPYISEIIDGGSASESDLQGWTWIKAVNGRSTNNLPLEDVTKLIVGPEGSTVTLQIDNRGQLKDFTLTRRKTQNPGVLDLTIPSLIPYRVGKRWGFANKDKKIVLEPKYEKAFPFSEGLSVVHLNGRQGLIDTTGKEIIPVKFSWIGSVAEGMVAFEEGGLYGYMDIKGRTIVPPKYKSSSSFNNGFAQVKGTNGYYGFINKEGREITPLKYEKADDFYGALAAVAINDRNGFIDRSGREVVPLKFSSFINLPRLSNGMYKVYNGKVYGYVDAGGREVIPCQYSDAVDFKNGVGAVKSGGKWIAINKKGEQIGTGAFGEVTGGYSLGLLANSDPSMEDGLYGYSFLDGKIKIPYTYKYASDFVGSYAKATTDFSSYFIINAAGKKMTDENFGEIKMFANGITLLKKNNKWAYANTALKTFTPYKYDYAYEFTRGVAWVNFLGSEGYYVDARGTEYVDTEAEQSVTAEAEKNKYANDINRLNMHPSDGGAEIKRDDLLAAHLSKEDEKANLSTDGWRHLDRYTLSIKKGDRLRLRLSSLDFGVTGLLKSPSGVQGNYFGFKNRFISMVEIDTVLQEEGNYMFFVTSTETEKEGQYAVSKQIASPAALALEPAAGFCTRLNFFVKQAAATYDFVTGNLISEKNNGFVTINTWSTPIQLEKGKEGILQTSAFGKRYTTTLAESSAPAELQKKFADYEKQIRSCLTGFDFKLKESAPAEDDLFKSLEATQGFLRKVILAIIKDDSGRYRLNVTVE